MYKDFKEITWSAPEYRHYDKDISWYWLSLIGAGILFLVALWQGNFLFGIFIILAETLILFWAREFPKYIQFKIDNKGVRIDKMKNYLYKDLEGFHVLEESDGVSELILKTKSKLHPYVKILLSIGISAEVRELLKNYLEEVEYEESLSDGISKMIGF